MYIYYYVNAIYQPVAPGPVPQSTADDLKRGLPNKLGGTGPRDAG